LAYWEMTPSRLCRNFNGSLRMRMREGTMKMINQEPPRTRNPASSLATSRTAVSERVRGIAAPSVSQRLIFASGAFAPSWFSWEREAQQAVAARAGHRKWAEAIPPRTNSPDPRMSGPGRRDSWPPGAETYGDRASSGPASLRKSLEPTGRSKPQSPGGD